MRVNFTTPSRISLVDLTSIGDSVKRGDETKIGRFSSGLKHSMALFLRMGVTMTVNVYGGEEYKNRGEYDGYDMPYTDTFEIDTYMKSDEASDKEVECIKVLVNRGYHGLNGCALTQIEGYSDKWEELTGFAKAMGFNWENWMSLREIYSNMVDEGGYYSVDDYPEPVTGTVFTLEFDETNPFFEVWQNRHLYINESEPLFDIGNGVQILDNEEGYLRIYKQNILVYEDKEKKSKYAYNINFGAIDERRILSNLYSVEGDILNAIMYTKNEEFLRTIIRPEFDCDKEFLSGRSCYVAASTLIHDIAFEVYEKHGQVESYDWLLNAVKQRKDCKIGGKIITTIEDSTWSYSSKVTVESTPQTIAEPSVSIVEEWQEEPVEYLSSFAAEIKKHYNFNLDVEVKQAQLKGSKVVADKYDKCLIIDNDFDIETDFHNFIVEYVDLTMSGNAVSNLGKYICNLLKK